MNRFIALLKGGGSQKAEIIILALLSVLFFVSSTLRIFYPSDVFPFVNGAIVLLSILLFRGKYRIYVLSFYLSSNWCLEPTSVHIGSMSTWCVLAYLLVVFIERSASGTLFSKKEVNILLLYIIFAILMLISFFANLKTQSFVKYVSTILYIGLPLAFRLDSNAEKKLGTMLFALSFGVITANFFGIVFIYVLPSLTKQFVNVYMTPGDFERIQHYTLANFRYPGPTGDPNHGALAILFASTLEVIYIAKIGVRKVLHSFLLLLLQVGALLGGSKTYLICVVVLILMSAFFFTKKRGKIIAVGIISVGLIIFLILSIGTSFGGGVRRLLFADTRDGFLDALTTSRFSIFKNYMNYFPSDPLRLVFGHGFWAGDLIAGLHFHNFYIQILYEFGLFGSLFFVLYFISFFNFDYKNGNYCFIMPIFLIAFFSLSLHILSDINVWISLFVLFSLGDETSNPKSKFRSQTNRVEITYSSLKI